MRLVIEGIDDTYDYLKNADQLFTRVSGADEIFKSIDDRNIKRLDELKRSGALPYSVAFLWSPFSSARIVFRINGSLYSTSLFLSSEEDPFPAIGMSEAFENFLKENEFEYKFIRQGANGTGYLTKGEESEMKTLVIAEMGKGD